MPLLKVNLAIIGYAVRGVKESTLAEDELQGRYSDTDTILAEHMPRLAW